MNRKVILFIAAFILLYFSMGSISEFFVDYEWFKLNRGPELYWVLFFAKFNVGMAFTVAFVVLFFLNFLL
jgi:hypothetical protein